MCLADGADYGVTVYRESWHRARKAYKCIECRRGISVGERYRYNFQVYEGRPSDSLHTCEHCGTIACPWLVEHCRGYLFKGVEEDIANHVEYGPWSADEERQPIKMSLPARIVVAMRRKWQRFDGGGLMAVRTLAS